LRSQRYEKQRLGASGQLSQPSRNAIRPSEEDIRLAFDPKASYLILSLKDDTPVLKSFNISSGQATQEELSIVGRKHRWQMLIIKN